MSIPKPPGRPHSADREELLNRIEKLIVEYDCRDTGYAHEVSRLKSLAERCCVGMSQVIRILNEPGRTAEERIYDIETLIFQLQLDPRDLPQEPVFPFDQKNLQEKNP